VRRKSAKDRQRELHDDVRLVRAWHQFHAEELETAMNGAHGSIIARLMENLHALELGSGPTLIDFIKARNWHAVDAHTRLVVLHELNRVITKLRTCNGLESIDDPLWDECENVFRTIKAILFPLPAASGANRSESRPHDDDNDDNLLAKEQQQ
jgi:hypothetical protein